MKGTEHFKRTIKEYLDGKARTDELFAVSYAKENKNLDDCITFILNQVKASGCCGMTDDEVWSLAIHYYDEDNIDVGKPISCGVGLPGGNRLGRAASGITRVNPVGTFRSLPPIIY